MGDAASSHTMELMHHAASKGHDSVVTLLCNRGAKADVQTHGSQRPIQLACHGGHVKTVAVLLDYGALGVLGEFGEGGLLKKWKGTPLEELARRVESLRLLRDEAEEFQDMGSEAEAVEAFKEVISGYCAMGMHVAAAQARKDAGECGVDVALLPDAGPSSPAE